MQKHLQWTDRDKLPDKLAHIFTSIGPAPIYAKYDFDDGSGYVFTYDYPASNVFIAAWEIINPRSRKIIMSDCKQDIEDMIAPIVQEKNFHYFINSQDD